MKIFRSAAGTKQGVVRLARYLALIALSFLVIRPVIMLVSTSGKDLYGLVDPLVRWVPTSFTFSNYSKALRALGGWNAMLESIGMIGLMTLAQVVSGAMTGYGFAKQGFKGRSILFAVMVAAFFVPQQVTYLSQYVQFSRYRVLGTIWPMVLTAATAQGIKSTLIILLFYQFFKMVPVALEEAALVDGAGLTRILMIIDVPLVTPATIITSVLTFSWYWNDTYFTDLFFKGKLTTMTLSLTRVKSLFNQTFGGEILSIIDDSYNGGIEAAAALIVILPLIVLFLLLERKLLAGVDRVGITGE